MHIVSRLLVQQTEFTIMHTVFKVANFKHPHPHPHTLTPEERKKDDITTTQPLLKCIEMWEMEGAHAAKMFEKERMASESKFVFEFVFRQLEWLRLYT